MRIILFSILLMVFQVHSLAYSDHLETEIAPQVADAVTEYIGQVRSQLNLEYESSSMDGAILELENVSLSAGPNVHFDKVRFTNLESILNREQAKFSLEVFGASMDNGNDVETIEFDHFQFELPSETFLQLVLQLSEEEGANLFTLLQTFQLDKFVIKKARIKDANCNLSIDLLKIEDIADLMISAMNLEQFEFMCSPTAGNFHLRIPYIKIDNLSTGNYPNLVISRLLSASDQFPIVPIELENDVPLEYAMSWGPLGLNAKEIRVSEIFLNTAVFDVEASEVSFYNRVENNGNTLISSMTPMTLSVKVADIDSELAERAKALFDVAGFEDLTIRFRREQHLDVENDVFSLPLNHNYIELNDLGRLNLMAEIEGIASIVQEVEYRLASAEDPEETIEIDPELLKENLKYRQLGIDFTDMGLVDHAFEAAAKHFDQSPGMLRGTAGVMLKMLPFNNDFGLNSEEREKFAENCEIVGEVLKKQGTLSARFSIDNSFFDFDNDSKEPDDLVRKLLIKYMTLEFVE